MPFFSRSKRDDDTPRRRRDDGEDGAQLAFEVTDFEFVPAGAEMGLLRLSGTWLADPDQMVPVPIELEVERDGEAVRLCVLPDPNMPPAVAVPGGEPWRGAFMAETELAEDPRSDFALVAGGEVVAGLPRPGDWEIDEGYVDSADEDELPAEDAEGALAEVAVDAESKSVSELLEALEEVAAMEHEEEAVQPLEIDVDDVVAEHVTAREVMEEKLDAANSTIALLRHEVEGLREVADSAQAEREAAEAEARELRELAEREQAAREAAEAEAAGLREDSDRERTARETAGVELSKELDRERRARQLAEAAVVEAQDEADAALAAVREELSAERAAREAVEARAAVAGNESVAEAEAAREAAELALVQLRDEIAGERATRQDLDAAAERGQAERAELAATVEQERQRHQAAESELRRELEDARTELETAASETARVRSELDGTAAERETELHDLRAELDRARAELESAKATTPDGDDGELERVRTELQQTNLQIEALNAALEDRRAELDYVRGQHAAELDDHVARLEAAKAEVAAHAAAEPTRDDDGDDGDDEAFAQLRSELEAVRAELDLERRRRDTIEEELRVQISIERQLRDVIAGREAELAAAESPVVRRVRAAERRREAEAAEPREVEGDFFARLEHAKRLSGTSG